MTSIVSCTQESHEPCVSKTEKRTCNMKLIGSIYHYDEVGTKAEAPASTWADSSIIYLRMTSPLGATTGEAIYDLETDAWTISYYGSLYEDQTSDCVAYYFENMTEASVSNFILNENSAIYEDLQASYIFQGGDLIVTANLSPKTGRIRFSGDAGKELKIYGISHYGTYDLNTDIYTISAEPFKIKVQEDGYTPYFYGSFTDTEEPNIKVWIDAKEAYTKFCSQSIFQAGQSGKLTIPTENAHNGWIDGLHFNVNGARFKMVAVEGGKFVMGDPDSDSEYYKSHNVTLTGFCIGETEVTNLLYSRIIKSSANVSDPDMAYYYISHASALSKITELNKLLNTAFNLPTEAQWEFAAKGGTKSKGYVYSGSNNIVEVAWYNGNAKAIIQKVKQKRPNELGIYDMTGNVMEWVKDYYAPYPASKQVDPDIKYPGTGTENYVRRGGSYYDGASLCYNHTRSKSNLSDIYTGFRLALNWN